MATAVVNRPTRAVASSFGSHTAYSFWYVIGNKTVTMAANVLFDSWISDLETCFKLGGGCHLRSQAAS